MMTAQEALEHFGYVAWGSDIPLKIGEVRVEENDDGMVPLGAKVVIVGEMSPSEVEEFHRICGGWSPWPRHYKRQ
jgi:hypothetical protein